VVGFKDYQSLSQLAQFPFKRNNKLQQKTALRNVVSSSEGFMTYPVQNLNQSEPNGQVMTEPVILIFCPKHKRIGAGTLLGKVSRSTHHERRLF